MTMARAELPDHTSRFLGKAEVYSMHRPRYPKEILAALSKAIDFDQEKVVADIGSGTGILSALFLENGNMVYCVEPNRDMRKAAEDNLSDFASRFVSVVGKAEDTRLPDRCADLATAGQALHWFDLGATRKEFARILRPGGHVAIVYNHRRDEGEVERTYSQIIEKYSTMKPPEVEVDDAYVAKFLNNGDAQRLVFPNSQALDGEGMLGRLASASYMPSPGSDGYEEVREAVYKMFEDSGKSELTLHYDTVMHLGRVTP